MTTHDTTSSEKIAGVTITISQEHRDFEKDISECFDEKFITEANLMRFSDAPLHMQVMINLATWIGGNIAWDLIKAGLKNFYEKFPKAHTTIRYKGVMYIVGIDGSVKPVVVDIDAYAHIRNTDDLIKHIELTSEVKNEQQSEWKEATLGELTDIKGGKRLPLGTSLILEKTEHPYIRITDLDNNGIKKEQLQFVPNEIFPQISRYIVNTGDIILSIVGSIGFVALIDEELDNASLTENCVKFVNLRNIDSRFLYYFLISREGQGEINKNTVGAVQKKLPIYGVQNIKILLPPLPEQRAIADMLSSLDAKIELFREQNETLEKTAQTIFQEWFGRYSVESPEELPDGWRVGKLGEVIENFDSQRIPIASDKREKGEFPYYGATGINDYVSDYIFDGIYTLLGEDGSVIKENGKPFTQYVWGKIWVNNHAHVLQGKNGFSTELIKIILDRTDIAPFVNGAVQLKINQTNMNSIPVVIPANDSLQEFNELIQPIFEKLRSNSEQIQSLSKTRDMLLPKLMNGEVRITLK